MGATNIATNIVKNSDKEKYIDRGYGRAFDGKGEWSFGNGYARNVIIFGVANSYLMLLISRIIF